MSRHCFISSGNRTDDYACVDVRGVNSVQWGFILSLAVCGLISALVSFGVLFYYRNILLVKMSQPIVMFTLLLGICFAFARCIVGLQPLSTSVCAVGIWLEHIAFSLVLISIAVKSWRVHVVLNSGMRKVTVSKVTVGLMMAGTTCVIIGLLAWDTTVSPPFAERIVVSELLHCVIVEKMCSHQGTSVRAPVLLLCFTQSGLLIIAMYFTYLARDAKSNADNAQRTISGASSSFIIMIIFIVVLLFLSVMYCGAAAALSAEKRSPTFSCYIYLFLVELAYWKCLLTYFGRLTYFAARGFDLNEFFQLSKRCTNNSYVPHTVVDSCTAKNMSTDQNTSIPFEVGQWRNVRVMPR